MHDGGAAHARVRLDAASARTVHPGQPAWITVDDIPDEKFTGVVMAVTPNRAHPTKAGGYTVTIALAKPDPRLRHGQPVHACIVTHTQHAALVVPNSAVIRSGTDFFVDVLSPGGQRERVQFQPGAIGDDNTQVLAGLHEGQQVILVHQE